MVLKKTRKLTDIPKTMNEMEQQNLASKKTRQSISSLT
jgi:hypothetical protein